MKIMFMKKLIKPVIKIHRDETDHIRIARYRENINRKIYF